MDPLSRPALTGPFGCTPPQNTRSGAAAFLGNCTSPRPRGARDPLPPTGGHRIGTAARVLYGSGVSGSTFRHTASTGSSLWRHEEVSGRSRRDAASMAEMPVPQSNTGNGKRCVAANLAILARQASLPGEVVGSVQTESCSAVAVSGGGDRGPHPSPAQWVRGGCSAARCGCFEHARPRVRRADA